MLIVLSNCSRDNWITSGLSCVLGHHIGLPTDLGSMIASLFAAQRQTTQISKQDRVAGLYYNSSLTKLSSSPLRLYYTVSILLF